METEAKISKGHTLFISDLHLDEAYPEIAAIFLKFLEKEAPKADALYILGDFFEVWLGDDNRTPFNQKITSKLHELSQKGLSIYLMRGNRDFLLGSTFAREAGLKLLDDPTQITLYDQPILLLHGDTLCALDRQYQYYRYLVHHPLFQAIALWAPLFVRRFFGNRMRRYSEAYTKRIAAPLKDVSLEAVISVLKKSHCHLMIHGHTHRPAIHALEVEGGKATRIVLGAWHERGNALIYREDGTYELLDFN